VRRGPRRLDRRLLRLVGARAARPTRRGGLLAALAVVALPGVAGAHAHSGIVGVSERARIVSAPPEVRAAVDRGDLALRLRVASGHTVSVPGVRATGRSPTWHDARVRRARGGWAIPLVVDGRPARLAGTTVHVPAPPAWPWLALALPLLALASPRRAAALGALAAAAILATAATYAVDAYASTGTIVESADEAAVALVAVAVLVRGRETARMAAAGALGTLALFAGLTKFGALTSGIVLSPLPAALARGVVVLDLAAGAAAVIAAGAVLLRAEPARTPAAPAPTPDSFWSLRE
jgi:hypothetical protein